jgi:hypothetical protein
MDCRDVNVEILTCWKAFFNVLQPSPRISDILQQSPKVSTLLGDFGLPFLGWRLLPSVPSPECYLLPLCCSVWPLLAHPTSPPKDDTCSQRSTGSLHPRISSSTITAVISKIHLRAVFLLNVCFSFSEEKLF